MFILLYALLYKFNIIGCIALAEGTGLSDAQREFYIVKLKKYKVKFTLHKMNLSYYDLYILRTLRGEMLKQEYHRQYLNISHEESAWLTRHGEAVLRLG